MAIGCNLEISITIRPFDRRRLKLIKQFQLVRMGIEIDLVPKVFDAEFANVVANQRHGHDQRKLIPAITVDDL